MYGLEGPSSSTVSLSKVCFSAHSLPADLLTTCFDENFLHGEADETCMCGDEDPHIHAHLTGSDCHGNEMGLTKFKLVPKKEQVRSDEERRTKGWSEEAAAYHPPLQLTTHSALASLAPIIPTPFAIRFTHRSTNQISPSPGQLPRAATPRRVSLRCALP